MREQVYVSMAKEPEAARQAKIINKMMTASPIEEEDLAPAVIGMHFT